MPTTGALGFDTAFAPMAVAPNGETESSGNEAAVAAAVVALLEMPGARVVVEVVSAGRSSRETSHTACRVWTQGKPLIRVTSATSLSWAARISSSARLYARAFRSDPMPNSA